MLDSVFAPAPLPVVDRFSLLISGWLRSVRPNACDGLITLMLWLTGEFLHSAVIAASGNRPDFPKMVFSLVPLGGVLAYPPVWLIDFRPIQRGRCAGEFYSVVLSVSA